MATYIKGVTDFIPQLTPFKPDYKFLSDVLNVRQDRYDSNFKTLNSLYSKVVHAPLSREDNLEVRDQYANQLSNGLKQVTGIDLSLQQNVDIAKGLFKPFFDDKKVVKDMAFTKLYSKEMQQANSYMTSASEEMRDDYWQVGVEDLKYQMQDYKAADADAAVNMPMPSYVVNPNIYERSFEALKDSELSIKQTTLEGDWIITTKNGTALTRQIVGYEMTEDGKNYKLDKNNREIPIYRNPAAEYLKNTVMKDPIVLRGLLTEAKVKQRQFSESEENIQKYGSIEGAKQFWATDIIERQSQDDLKELVEKESELKKETIAARNWEDYKRLNNIIPGTPEDELFLLAQFNKRLVKTNRDAVKSRIIDSKAPVSDIDGLLNKAYSMYMASVMGPKMNAAAIAYSQVDSEQTFEANPFKKMEHQHRYDLNRMAIQNSYDINKIAMKGNIDMALAKYKASTDNTTGNINRLGLNGGMFVEEGDANISGSLTGVDLDGDGTIDRTERVNVNVLEENKQATIELGNEQTNTEIAFLETLLRELPNDMLDESMYKGNGELTYSFYDPNTKQTTQKTATIKVAWEDLNNGSPVNRVEFDRILNNMSSKYTDLIQTSDGTSLNYNLAGLNLKPAVASIIHEQYKSVLKGRERLNLKVEEMNKVYHQAFNYSIEKNAQMENSNSYQTQEFAIPPILLTQGEINMLNEGVPWYQVKEASENGKLEEPIVDGQGKPVRKFIEKEEYQTLFANMNYLMAHQRTELNTQQMIGGGLVGPHMGINSDEDDYDFLVSENGFWNDTETLAQRYWNYSGGGGGFHSSPTTGIPVTTSGSTYEFEQESSSGWNFNRDKALSEGAEKYDEQKANMNAVMSSDVAADQGLVFNLRSQMLGQKEEGVGETGYNTYTSTYDVASESSLALAQMESIVNAIQQIPSQNLDYTYSLGNNLDQTTSQINNTDNASSNKLMKQIFKHTLMDINTGRLDKSDGRPYVFSTYVEKVGGPDQENDIAGYNIGFGMEYAKNYKHLFIGSDGKIDDKAFAKFASEGITITIPQAYDNNPFKSSNQMLSYTDLAIKDNGQYNSVPVINGGSYSIYKNSANQYIQESKIYLFNDKTGGTPPSDVVSFVLGVDPQELDNITVNMDQYLTELAVSNTNKKTAWDLKNSKTTPVKK